MSSRPKRFKVGEESIVRELLEESEDDMSSFSELLDDTDEDDTYIPPNLSDDDQSSNGK